MGVALQSVGVAPKWCSFLDNLTEELEEDPEPTIYDDYKFVSPKDLDELGQAGSAGDHVTPHVVVMLLLLLRAVAPGGDKLVACLYAWILHGHEAIP